MTGCIRIDSELHVQLFFKGAPVPLPQLFRHERDCRLSRKSMLENFPANLQSRKELYSSVFGELHSANIVRYALLLRYTSIQSYKMLLEASRYDLRLC